MASVRDYPPAPGGHLQDAAQEIWGAEAQERKKGDVSQWGRNVATWSRVQVATLP